MNNLELLKEQYAEQMFEQRANGIPTISFEEWKNATPHAEDIAEGMIA